MATERSPITGIALTDSAEIPNMAAGVNVDEDDLDDMPNQSITSRFTASVGRVRKASIHSIHELHSNDRNNSAFVAGWNVTNLIQGIGILGVPFAFSRGSWAAIPLTLVVAAACCYTGQLIVECLYDICPRTGLRIRVRDSYGSIGRAVWPRFGQQIVTTVCITEMFGGLILYIILLSRMSSTLITPIFPAFDIYYCSLVVTYAGLPLLYVTRMSVISWFSLLAVLGLLSTIGTVIGYCLSQVALMSVSNMPAFDITTFPVSIGIIVFSYCAHAVFPSIEASMRKPEHFKGMMNIAFFIAAVIKVGMGLAAVFIYGAATGQEVTTNMAENHAASVAISILVFINVFFSVPLVVFVVTERFDDALLPHFHPNLGPDGPLRWLWLTVTRLIILTFGLLIAMLVPHFALLMGLVGSCTGTCLCFLFPCYFYMRLRWETLRWWSVSVNVLIMIAGVVAGAFGIFFSAVELRNAFAGEAT